MRILVGCGKEGGGLITLMKECCAAIVQKKQKKKKKTEKKKKKAEYLKQSLMVDIIIHGNLIHSKKKAPIFASNPIAPIAFPS